MSILSGVLHRCKVIAQNTLRAQAPPHNKLRVHQGLWYSACLDATKLAAGEGGPAAQVHRHVQPAAHCQIAPCPAGPLRLTHTSSRVDGVDRGRSPKTRINEDTMI
jgi:hypothetical protein